ncbi:hypothetical protein [Erwinia phage FBB1]|nr:hypothetical protein [Erwinia phage FBB1]
MRISIKHPGTLLGMGKCKFPIEVDAVLFDVKHQNYVVTGNELIKKGADPEFFDEKETYPFSTFSAGEIYLPVKKEITWKMCVQISDELHEEIESLVDSPSEDNAACLIRSVIEKYLEKSK